MFWLAPVFQSKPQQQFLDWCLTGRNGLARWSQGLWGICVFNLVWYFADGRTSGLKCFFTSRQPGRTRHRAKDCPPDKKDEADVEVSDRYLLIGFVIIFNIMMVTDMVSPDHRNKGGALWFRTTVCVARAIPWNDGTHAVNKQIVKKMENKHQHHLPIHFLVWSSMPVVPPGNV